MPNTDEKRVVASFPHDSSSTNDFNQVTGIGTVEESGMTLDSDFYVIRSHSNANNIHELNVDDSKSAEPEYASS